MRRWLPHPTLSLFVLGTWLLLNQSLALGHILLGGVFGVGLGAVFVRFQAPTLRIRNRHRLLGLTARVVGDVVRSNLALFRIILSGKSRDVTSGFVYIPLDLTSPYGLAALACIITATPGTIWVSYQSHERQLLIHVFDLVDETVWIRTITDRYAAPLKEVFE